MAQEPTPQQRLYTAVRDGNVDQYFEALENGADVGVRPPGMDEDWIVTACQGASSRISTENGQRRVVFPGDHATIVEHLIGHAGLVPGAQHTGLLIAARATHLDLVKRLIALGFDPRAFNDRALALAVEKDKQDRLGRASPTGHARALVRLLLDHGCELGDARSQAREDLTASFMQEAKTQGVLALNRPALRRIQDEAEAFGVTLNANELLWAMAMARRDTLFTHRQDEASRGVDALALEIVDDLVERGGWTNAQGDAGHSPNGPFLLFAAKNGWAALLDRFVELGANPRMDDDKPLLNAAMNGQYEMVQHLLDRYGASLDGCNGQIRPQLMTSLMEPWSAAARTGHLDMLKALDTLAQRWEVELPAGVALSMCLPGDNGEACEAWLADKVGPDMWEEALNHHVALGRPQRAEPWFERLTVNGQACTDAMAEALFTLAGKKNRQESLAWLIGKKLDVVRFGPFALDQLNDWGDEAATRQWLGNQIEQEQLRREIATVAPDAPSAPPRARL